MVHYDPEHTKCCAAQGRWYFYVSKINHTKYNNICSIEETERNSRRNTLIPRRCHMKMVSDIDERIQLCRILGVAHGRIEIEDSIERTACANPLVDRQPTRLAVPSIVVRVVRPERRDGRAEDGEVLRVHARDDLLHGCDEVARYGGLRRGVCSGGTDVVNTFEEDDAPYACLGEDVAVDAAESVWP